MTDEESTLEYVRDGLANGQQVFRRSVVVRLIAELTEAPPEKLVLGLYKRNKATPDKEELVFGVYKT